jgi:hypothetical protein
MNHQNKLADFFSDLNSNFSLALIPIPLQILRRVILDVPVRVQPMSCPRRLTHSGDQGFKFLAMARSRKGREHPPLLQFDGRIYGAQKMGSQKTACGQRHERTIFGRVLRTMAIQLVPVSSLTERLNVCVKIQKRITSVRFMMTISLQSRPKGCARRCIAGIWLTPPRIHSQHLHSTQGHAFTTAGSNNIPQNNFVTGCRASPTDAAVCRSVIWISRQVEDVVGN